jgi:hypothetical protein
MYQSKRIKKKIVVSAYLCKLLDVITEEDYHSIVNKYQSNQHQKTYTEGERSY